MHRLPGAIRHLTVPRQPAERDGLPEDDSALHDIIPIGPAVNFPRISRICRDVGVQLASHEQLEFLPQADAGTLDASLAWAVREGSALFSGFIRCGSGLSAPATLDHDEVILVLGGRFGVELANGTVIDAGAGETINLARGTTVRYLGRDATVFFVRTESVAVQAVAIEESRQAVV